METQLKGTVPLKKAKRLGNGVVLLGASYCRPLSIEEEHLVVNDTWYGTIYDGEHAEFFTKAVVCGIVLHCKQYNRTTRRINYIVGLVDGTIVELKVFVAIAGLCFAFARVVDVDRPEWLRRSSECGRLCSLIYKIMEIARALTVVKLEI